MSKSRPSPRIQLQLRPPSTFTAFNRLVKAIGDEMDRLEIPFDVSSDYAVRNNGDVVSMYDPAGIVVATFNMQDYR